MLRIAQRLHEKVARYNWVGFYEVDPIDPGFLVVGPFAGSFSPNVRIPLRVPNKTSMIERLSTKSAKSLNGVGLPLMHCEEELAWSQPNQAGAKLRDVKHTAPSPA
jgi:hypothetical protein